MKDYQLVDKMFFDQPVKNDLRTYDNVRKVTIGHGDDYTTGCLIDYSYFKESYKLIEIDLREQQTLDAGLKSIHQINYVWNLDQRTNIFHY